MEKYVTCPNCNGHGEITVCEHSNLPECENKQNSACFLEFMKCDFIPRTIECNDCDSTGEITAYEANGENFRNE